MDDLSVIIPVLNEDHQTITGIVKKLHSYGAEVIVVDDGSANPYPKAVKHGFKSGYGGAILTGIANSTRSYVMTLDGDGQHTPEEALKLYQAWKLMDCDMLVGSRRMHNDYLLRYLGRKILNMIASVVATYWLNDLNSGMRIFSKKIAYGYKDILCKQFSFTTSLTMSMICDRYRVEFFPINVQERKHGASRVRIIKHGFITLWYILKIGFAIRTRKLRRFLRILLGKETFRYS